VLIASRILRRLRLSLDAHSLRDAALLVIAASLAVFTHDRSNWRPDPERTVALDLLAGDREAFSELVAQAHARQIAEDSRKL
jgi:hypothetical protein